MYCIYHNNKEVVNSDNVNDILYLEEILIIAGYDVQVYCKVEKLVKLGNV